MTTEQTKRWFQRTVQQVRRGGKSVRAFIVRVQRDAALAIWPAVLAAILGPVLIALTPALRGTVAEFLPPGPERVLVTALMCASGVEIVRSQIVKFRLTRRLRAAEAEVAKLRQSPVSSEAL